MVEGEVPDRMTLLTVLGGRGLRVFVEEMVEGYGVVGGMAAVCAELRRVLEGPLVFLPGDGGRCKGMVCPNIQSSPHGRSVV